MPARIDSDGDTQCRIFYGTLLGPLMSGQCLIIAGTTAINAESIRINLFSRNDVIDLSLDILIGTNVVKRSAFVNDRWTEEEVESNLLSTNISDIIKPDEPFTINIVATDENFRIAINDCPYCTFRYVIPVGRVQAVRMYGDLAVLHSFDHRQLYPSSIPKLVKVHENDVFSSQVAKRFRPGNIIVLHGTPMGKKNGHMVIYFTEDTKLGSCGFYFDARFSSYTVVLNCMNPRFRRQNEVRIESFPFKVNEEFRMAIAFTPKFFRIAVNGSIFCSFPYWRRDLLKDLNGMRIRTRFGMDVKISMVAQLKISSTDCKGFEIFSE